MLFERIESPGLAHYSYLVGDAEKAVVIDPRRDCDIYIRLASVAGMRIVAILETHRHEDFIVGSTELASRTGAEVWHADVQLPYEYGLPVEDGQMWWLGLHKLQAIHTPGHTEGSMSYVLYTPDAVPWMVFVGDVLFAGEVGRVDFLGMDRAPEMAGNLYESIFEKLLPLGDGVLVWSCHGYGSACGSSIAERLWTTLGLERQLNPRLQFTEPEAFIEHVTRKLPKPPYFTLMERRNLEGTPLLGTLPDPAPLTPAEFAAIGEEAIVIDTRDLSAFAAAHIPGALAIGLHQLPNYVGWFATYDLPLLLVVDNNRPGTAVEYLVRQGYDGIAGYLAGGMAAWHSSGLPVSKTGLLTPQELVALLAGDEALYLIDVRSPEEAAGDALPGAHHLPLKQLPERIAEIPEDQLLCVYCTSGSRSILAASLLQRAGWENVSILLGGISAYNAFKA